MTSRFSVAAEGPTRTRCKPSLMTFLQIVAETWYGSAWSFSVDTSDFTRRHCRDRRIARPAPRDGQQRSRRPEDRTLPLGLGWRSEEAR